MWEEVYEPENTADMSQKYGRVHEQKYAAFSSTIKRGKSLYLIVSIFGAENLLHRVHNFIRKIEEEHGQAL